MRNMTSNHTRKMAVGSFSMHSLVWPSMFSLALLLGTGCDMAESDLGAVDDEMMDESAGEPAPEAAASVQPEQLDVAGSPGTVTPDADCSWGRISTQRWGGWSVCRDRSHRVVLYCHNQFGTDVVFGPWKSRNVQSTAICAHATQSMEVWADWPE